MSAACLAAICSASPAAPPRPDFNGDGFDDLAVRISGEDVFSLTDAGAVAVFYGSATGVSVADDQYWTAHTAGASGGAQAGDLFGQSLAWGDFNGDGYSDLAVGLPERLVDGVVSAGAVHVMYGTIAGLSASGSMLITQGAGPTGAGDAPATNDSFGSVLAAGDFNGDGHDDLAIGAPDEDADGRVDSGMVHVIEGSNAGLALESARIWRQDRQGVPDASQNGDAFGAKLASGDFNGDGADDLAIAAPLEDRHGVADAGVVTVLYGGETGLRAHAAQLWHQDIAGVPGVCQTNDRFGAALASGDFNGDDHDDLAVGVPGQAVLGFENAGIVHVFHGGNLGLKTAGNQQLDEPGPSPNEAGENFGRNLASGDINGDGFDELVAAINNNRLVSHHGSQPQVSMHNGGVYIVRGSASGLTNAQHQFLWQGTNSALSFERFGASLVVADFDNDGQGDLGIGVPGERVGPHARAGLVYVVPGRNAPLSLGSGQVLSQDSPGVKNDAEPLDGFGE
jgi:hypothetical protein